MENRLDITNKENVSFININRPKCYEVDFEKVNSIYQLGILIEVLFKGLNIVIQEDSEYYEILKEILKEIQ